MKYEDIKDFNQRCEEHKDHQTGMISTGILACRMQEEIDELREYIEQRTWVGLTDEEMYKVWLSVDEENDRMAFGKAIEAKLRNKNGY